MTDTPPSTKRAPASMGEVLIVRSRGTVSDDRETVPPPPPGADDLAGRAWDYLHDRDVTIVVADDDEALRNALADQLEERGYRVRTAYDGKDAIDKCFEGPPPDLVIVDVRMPRISGPGVANALVYSDLAHVPVMLISATEDGIPKNDGWLFVRKDKRIVEQMSEIIDRKVIDARRRRGE